MSRFSSPETPSNGNGNHEVRKESNILVVPKPSLYRQLFSAASDATLRSLGQVTFNEEERDWASDELAQKIAPFDIVVTSWRTPKFTEAVMTAAEKLRLIAHSAGSVKFMFDDEVVFDRGISVTTAAPAMASAVAEYTLMLIMLCLRPIQKWDRRMKAAEPWLPIKAAGMGQEIAGQRVGIVGAGHVGRSVITLLKAVGCEIAVYDPYLKPTAADALGVTRVEKLDDLLTGYPIISLHSPATAETWHMIGKRELSLLRVGAIFINTARSQVVDEAALIAELKTGRIIAAVDVFDEEPLPENHPFRQLSNCIVTPHLAAATLQCQLRQGDLCVADVERFVKGQPLKYPVTREMLPTMA